jgi:hypothetical protein
MKSVEKNRSIKKNISKMFPDAVINNELKKYGDSPVILKKAADAKKFLANFKFS